MPQAARGELRSLWDKLVRIEMAHLGDKLVKLIWAMKIRACRRVGWAAR
jgi:archaellum biogenesis ATPase FlaH